MPHARLTRALAVAAAGFHAANHVPNFCHGLKALPRLRNRGPAMPLFALTSRRAGAISRELLLAENDLSTNSVIEYFKATGDSHFKKLSQLEQNALEERDKKDAEFLANGVQKAIDEGLLGKLEEKPLYKNICVLSNNAKECAEVIVSELPKEGCIVVLVGGSGTGKQTTVNAIMRLLPSALAWSNGDCFRSLTMLARLHSEQKKEPIPDCLTSGNLDTWASMLEVTSEGDILIRGLGMDEKVSEIKNTLLKAPDLEQILPKVASLSQATVLGFARRAVETLRKAGQTVLLEGREETLDHIPSQHRFRLTIPKGTKILGERRLAQRVLARTVQMLKSKDDELEELRVEVLLEKCLRDEVRRRDELSQKGTNQS